MIVCITGATGFIGRRLVEAHLKLNDEVRYLTRTNHQPLNGAIAFMGDVNATEGVLVPFLKDANVIYHCAGEVESEALMHHTHVDGTHNLLHVLEKLSLNKQKILHWIQLSSCGAYGQNANSSSVERYVTESSLDNPNGIYESTKAKSDEVTIQFSQKNEWFKYTIFRPTIVFGMGMRSTAIIRLARLIRKRIFFYIRHRNTIANYVHVDDVVNAMRISVNEKESYNQTFIIANDCLFRDAINAIAEEFAVLKPNLVINERLLRVVINVFGGWVKLPINHSQIDVMMRQTHYSNQKLCTLLGWRPLAPAPVQIKLFLNTNMHSDD